MLEVWYEGWFQCRLPTDPDPTDEPWGITGATFAGPGESPLDRVVRLQDPRDLRYPQTELPFGVNVTSVVLARHGDDGSATRTPLPDHPLIGGRLSFLNDAMYHQRNYIVVGGLLCPIDPFHICLETDSGIRITRKDEWDETRPGLTVEDVFLDPNLLGHRKQTTIPKSALLVEETGITDYAAHFDERCAVLVEKLKETTDPTERAGLEKRIAFIRETDSDIGTRVTAQQFLGLLSTYDIDVNGASEITLPKDGPSLGGIIGTSQVWPMKFWMGSYDVDTLCGYMKGSLMLPFHAQS